MFSAALPSTPAIHGTFSGHETFVFRYGWLKKGMDAACDRSTIFTAEEAVAVLGVGKNMVRAIRHWGLAMGLLEEAGNKSGVLPTSFAQFLLADNGADPYLERDGSLWLLHWKLATNIRRAPTWYWAFNLCRDAEWTRDSLQAGIFRWAQAQGWTRLAAASLKSDVSVFSRTYAPGRRGPASTPEETLECPLVGLRLITSVEKKDDDGGERYRFNSRPKATLPAAVFTFALVDFWKTWRDGSPTLSLREITHGEGSPGRVFRLDEDGVLSYLDGLETLTASRLAFQDTALLRQVICRVDLQTVEPMEFLRDFYRSF